MLECARIADASLPSRSEATLTKHTMVSLESHILRGEALHPGSTGDFTWILSALSLAAKVIAAKVRRARIEDVLGAEDAVNIHGEAQQKLDILANEVLMACLGDRPSVSIVASEEHEEPTILRLESEGGKYCVIFDPLDGSSNLDVCAGVGHDLLDPTARARRRGPGRRALSAWLPPGCRRLHSVWVVDGVRADYRQRSRPVRPRPVHRLVRPRQRQPADSPARHDLLGQRGILARLPGGHPPLPGLGAPEPLLEPVYRVDGRRRPPHAAHGRSVPLSADRGAPRGKAAADVPRAIRWG